MQSTQKSGPYLSIIVTTRNDNHGGDLLQRTCAFVRGVIYQANRTQCYVELIIVEWNPPVEKPPLKDLLPHPIVGDFVTLRYIVVPPEIHNRYRFSGSMGLYQMIAKNVGIRRATAPFILCTNVDILFSDDCFNFMASGRIKEGEFYRNSRCDIPKEVLKITDPKQQLVYAKVNILKRIGGINYIRYIRLVPVTLFSFINIMRLLDSLWRMIELGIFKNNRDHLGVDTQACGDFTLMSRQDWLKIEGYPEIDLYSIHIDSMALLAANALGIKQVLLNKKQCVYHIFHTEGWESFENSLQVIRFMEKRPGLDWHFVSEAGRFIYKTKRGWQINKPTWGFSNLNLKEHIFNPIY